MEGRDERVRIGKLIASRGVASRRNADELVTGGLVTVNGTMVILPGTLVDPHDDVRVDGRRLPAPPQAAWYIFYKPRGVLASKDDTSSKASILDYLKTIPFRVEPVGHIDIDGEGAMLLTNDGEALKQLTRASSLVPRRYVVKVWKTPTDRALKAIEEGRVFVEGSAFPPAKVRVLEKTDAENTWVEITITQGRHGDIRRVFDQLGHPISKLRRESFATVSIRGMERGDIRPLTAEELRRVQDIAAGRRPERASVAKRKMGFAVAKPKERRAGKGGRRSSP
jgi:23S rRNA pseudouridine2605 synthase